MEPKRPIIQVEGLRGKVAAVNCSRRLALLASISILFLQVAANLSCSRAIPVTAAPTVAGPATVGAELRPGFLDMILLLDKSLSMAPFFEEAKAYVAGTVIGPILVPGDRLIVETVYGKVDRLISTSIGSEEDKAKAIRAIRVLRADGRFTDLGAALDAAKRDLDELGQTDRPKYVLLITDERQEAPKGSPYQASDYKLKHPSLEYIKREDLGKFRAITVGLQVGAKVEKNAPAVMKFLMNPPVRGESGEVQVPDSQWTGSTTPGGSASERALPAWLLGGAAALFVLAVAGLTIIVVLSKKRKKEKASDLKAEQ
jgi:von Willebrand factor type A domain